MTKKIEHEIFFGKTEDRTFVVSSATSPYFLFEGDSEEEVREIASRALNFYFGAEGEIEAVDKPRSAPRTNVSRIFRRKSEIINIGECAVAI